LKKLLQYHHKINRFLLITFLLITFYHGKAQSVSAVTDKLYFGLFTNQLDPSIKKFIKKELPILTETHSRGSWTAYPPDSLINQQYANEEVVFKFKKHPYFDGKFKNGQLIVTKKAYHQKDKLDNLTDLKLSFQFDQSNKGYFSFQYIVNQYMNFNVYKRSTKNADLEKWEFTDIDEKSFPRHATILYYKKELKIEVIADNNLYENEEYMLATKNFMKFFRENKLPQDSVLFFDNPNFLNVFSCLDDRMKDTSYFTSKDLIEIQYQFDYPPLNKWNAYLLERAKFIDYEAWQKEGKKRLKTPEATIIRNANGIYGISAPVFYRDYTYCIVSFGQSHDGLMFTGDVIVYKKKGDKWEMVEGLCLYC
jgi:hypothetical protein